MPKKIKAKTLHQAADDHYDELLEQLKEQFAWRHIGPKVAYKMLICYACHIVAEQSEPPMSKEEAVEVVRGVVEQLAISAKTNASAQN